MNQRQAKLLIIQDMIDASLRWDNMEKTFDAAVKDRQRLATALGYPDIILTAKSSTAT